MAFPAFRPEELQIVGWNSPPFGGMPRSPKFNTPIPPKENWQLVMEGKKPCWMPFSTDIQGFRPRIIPDNVVCGLVVDFVSLDGLFNTIIQAFGGEPIAFLSDPAWFRPIYVASEIWQNFGWDSVVFLAALSSIDLQQFEAAKLDGASRWQTIWHISLPSILPTIVTILLMRLGHVMSIGFEKVFNLYSPATYETADIIATFVYRQGVLGANYSSAAAIGLFNSVINLIIVFIMNKVSRKLAETSLW